MLLYKQAEDLKNQGNILISNQLLKVADHHGSLFIKEALSAKKKYDKKKEADMTKPPPERPMSKTSLHPGLKKRAYSKRTTQKTSSVMDYATKAYRYAANNPLLSNMGRGAAMTAGGALVAAPVASYAINKGSNDLMDKVTGYAKDYAVPGAIALAGLAAGAYNQYSNKKEKVASREKVGFLISGFKVREKLAESFGENSNQVSACDIAISRLLFRR